MFAAVVDLSHSVGSQIPLWPGDPEVRVEDCATHEEHGYFLRKLTIGEHSGTHMVAPNCFFPGGAAIDAYPTLPLIPGVVIDCQEQAQQDACHLLSVADVVRWEANHGNVPEGSLVFLRTGWEDRWARPKDFINGMRFPAFSIEATQFLLDQRGVIGVATDTHGVDPPSDESFAVNRTVLGRERRIGTQGGTAEAVLPGGIVLECCRGMAALPAKGFVVLVQPLRIQGGSGAPAAVSALLLN
eukprot:TRINITY_DN48180_c0_g1_i1.p1 TRINITY_DN48180_c0_g1~~TRINITY_DN48180_c0_g1_i1.p1  ORF type:complete len:242 (+),score=31.55 TRINITY_DN48180_c0_g1_i1:22-747(+)